MGEDRWQRKDNEAEDSKGCYGVKIALNTGTVTEGDQKRHARDTSLLTGAGK
jgi:hypothetical protein